MKECRLWGYVPFILFFLACGKSTSVEDDTVKPLFTWTGELGEESISILITKISAETEPDGGAVMTAEGTSDGDPVELSIDIAGSANVDFESQGNEETATLAAGGVEVNIRFLIGDVALRASSGTLIFTRYDVSVGGKMAGEFDLGLIDLDPDSNQAAKMEGEFSAKFEE